MRGVTFVADWHRSTGSRPTGGYLLDIIDSVVERGAQDVLALTTSMHDLVVAPAPADDPPLDVVIVAAPGSPESSRWNRPHRAPGRERTEHGDHSTEQRGRAVVLAVHAGGVRSRPRALAPSPSAGGRPGAGTIDAVTVDLATLPAPLADAVRAARGRRRGFVAKPLVSKQPDASTAAWTAEVIESGEIDVAIAEVAAADPDLRS